MTRFARAKGSKASNERVPEEATSWAEMKAQLNLKNKEIEDAKKREEFMNQRTENYKAFLNEKALQNNNSEWSVFPNTKVGKQNMNKSVSVPKNKIKNSPEKFAAKDNISSDDEDFLDLKSKVDNALKDMEYKSSGSEVSNKVKAGKDISKQDVKVKKNKGKKSKSLVDEVQGHLKKTKGGGINVEQEKLSNNALKDTVCENGSDSDAPPDEQSAKKEVSTPIVKLKKMKKKKIKITVSEDEAKKTEQDQSKNTETRIGSDKQFKKTTKKRKIVEEEKMQKKIKSDQKFDEKQSLTEKKSKKKNKNTLSTGKPEKKIKENMTDQDLKKIEKKKQKRIKQIEKKKKHKEQLKQEKLAAEQNMSTKMDKSPLEDMSEVGQSNIMPSNIGNESNSFGPPKTFNKTGMRAPKIRDKEDHKRKKPYLPHKMFINGKELEVDYVEGFPVKKEDAERLKKLRKEMIAKGLPGSEIKFALKLERRRAEKAFAREKKKVCFNCRKSGHNLSECPELGKDELAQTQGSGICFKCGSTEHTHFECKVVRGQEFKYAKCFICNEQGHISRQCPDNARGLYPKGGSCNVCGDVTHLKKDCPKYQAQQQQLGSSVEIETFGDGNPDVLDGNSRRTKFPVNIKQNKIIKF